jgi:hypothetical protein
MDRPVARAGTEAEAAAPVEDLMHFAGPPVEEAAVVGWS